jgi:AcrR family transcriptional regulator
MVDVVSEHGAANITVAHVVARSGISRRTFYELFADREDCFLAAFDEAVQQITTVVTLAYEQPGSWERKMRAALTALLELLDHDRGTGRLVILETLGAAPRTLERRRRVLAQIITAVDQGRDETKHDGPPPLTAEGIVGGVLSLIHSRLLAGDGPLIELLNPLMAMIVLPYHGPAAARKELTHTTPKTTSRARRAGTDPLRDLEMRLTYRTVRVLLAIGAHPGASNRQIADTAGIRDQGQISKLLTRLEQLGLINNTNKKQAKGEPNAWTLTQQGTDVQKVISI